MLLQQLPRRERPSTSLVADNALSIPYGTIRAVPATEFLRVTELAQFALRLPQMQKCAREAGDDGMGAAGHGILGGDALNLHVFVTVGVTELKWVGISNMSMIPAKMLLTTLE